jgi:broad specificity phosphatase PhoE
MAQSEKEPGQVSSRKVRRPRRIVLLRHGQSEANVYLDLINRGEVFSYPPEFARLSDWDIKLTEEGRRQARETGKYLKERFGVFDACYVSPQQRTKETLEEVLNGYGGVEAELMKREVRFESRLREKD